MASLGLPKSGRLSRRADFDAVRRQGRSWHGTLMVMGCLRGTGTPAAPRLGVITSRKVGSAVERNRLRRVLREIFRVHRPGLPSGLWMVVVPRRAAVAATFQALRDEWRSLAARAGCLKA